VFYGFCIASLEKCEFKSFAGLKMTYLSYGIFVVEKVIDEFRILYAYQIYDLGMFLIFCGFPSLDDVNPASKVFIRIKSKISMFVYFPCTLVIISKQSFPNTRSQTITPIFPPSVLLCHMLHSSL
jgi:hypothetical protein